MSTEEDKGWFESCGNTVIYLEKQCETTRPFVISTISTGNIASAHGEISRIVLIVFHNLSGYDVHLFAKDLVFRYDKIICIPKTDDKYVSFCKYWDLEMPFIDSFRFIKKLTW